MPKCKNCKCENIIKNGKANGKQRYKCKECGLSFTLGDNRTNEKIIAKKALCVMLYSLGKVSFRMLAKIFKTHHSLVSKWIREAGSRLPHENISTEIKEIEFDEMWHFIKHKKTNYGLLKHLTEEQKEQLHGYLVNVTPKHSRDCTIK